MENEGSNPEKAVYVEKHTFGFWYVLLLSVLVVLYVALTIGAIVKHNWGTAAWAAPIGLVLIILMVNFLRLVFEVTDSQVIFGFGLVKKRFPRASLMSCEPYEIRFGNYMGYGIRAGLDRTVAYNTRSGPGVKLTFDGAKRQYVVSVDEPAYICRILAPGSQPADPAP